MIYRKTPTTGRGTARGPRPEVRTPSRRAARRNQRNGAACRGSRPHRIRAGRGAQVSDTGQQRWHPAGAAARTDRRRGSARRRRQRRWFDRSTAPSPSSCRSRSSLTPSSLRCCRTSGNACASDGQSVCPATGDCVRVCGRSARIADGAAYGNRWSTSPVFGDTVSPIFVRIIR